jgi:hypothetical protein
LTFSLRRHYYLHVAVLVEMINKYKLVTAGHGNNSSCE